MSNLKIYIHPISQPARALMMFVRANSIPHTEVFVDLTKGENKKEEFKKINPLQKVPVINHDGFLLKESVAILRYLARAFNVPDNWFPKESQAQARVDEYMEWQHLNTRTHVSLFFVETYVKPLMTKEPVNKMKAAHLLKNLNSCLEQIENVWLKDRPFIAGHNISIADLLAAAELEESALGGYDVKDHHPKIREYLERVRDTLHPHYDEVHTPLYELLAKTKQKRAGQ